MQMVPTAVAQPVQPGYAVAQPVGAVAHPVAWPTAPAGASLADELTHLSNLQASGALTPEQFEAAKQQVLHKHGAEQQGAYMGVPTAVVVTATAVHEPMPMATQLV